MRTVLATIETTNQSADLELSGDIALAELIPALVELFAGANALTGTPGGWQLGPSGGRPLPLERSLINCDIYDGARLTLLPSSVWMAQQQAMTQAAQTTPTTNDSGGISIRWRRDGFA